MNNDSIEQQLKYIQRKLNERTALSNLSNYANIAERLSKGNINIEIDSVNKIVSFGYGTNKLWMNISNKTLNGIITLLFANGTKIEGLLTSNSINDAKETPENYSNYAISAKCFIDFMNDVDENYAPLVHKHATTDIYKLDENEEEETLDDLLDGKSDVNHDHDNSYVQLSSVSDSVSSQSLALIPTNSAVINYCQNFLTVAMIQANTSLQTLLKGDTGESGKSAFEVWEEQQPIKYDQDGKTVIPYTYADYIQAITGPQGPQGIQGPQGNDGNDGSDGLSAYEIWLNYQPIQLDEEEEPIIPTETDFLQWLKNDSFLEWYCNLRQANINELTWTDICIDIVQSATITDSNNESISLWDVIFGTVEGAANVAVDIGEFKAIKASVVALETQIVGLQSQIFTVQGAVGSILSATVTENSIEAFDQVIDTAQTALDTVNGTQGSSIFQSIGNLATRFSSIFTRLRPTVNTASATVNNSVLHSSLLGAGEVL